MKIRIEGYQSSKDTTLEIEGLTVITGRSNIGKSAIVRSIEAVFENQKGNNFITNGMAYTQVSLEDLGTEVVWKKTKSSSSYTIDGKIYTKCGRGELPTDLGKLGILPVRANKRDYFPQIHSQFDGPFILGDSYSPAAAAELISASQDNQIVNMAVKLSKTSERDLNSEIKIRESDLVDLKKRGESLKPYRDKLNSIKSSVGSLNISIAELKTKVERLIKLRDNYKQAQKIKSLLSIDLKVPTLNIPSPDRIKPLRDLKSRWLSNQHNMNIVVPLYEDIRLEGIAENRNTLLALSQVRNKYKNSLISISDSDVEFALIESHSKDLTTEIDTLVTTLGYCPVCRK